MINLLGAQVASTTLLASAGTTIIGTSVSNSSLGAGIGLQGATAEYVEVKPDGIRHNSIPSTLSPEIFQSYRALMTLAKTPPHGGAVLSTQLTGEPLARFADMLSDRFSGISSERSFGLNLALVSAYLSLDLCTEWSEGQSDRSHRENNMYASLVQSLPGAESDLVQSLQDGPRSLVIRSPERDIEIVL